MTPSCRRRELTIKPKCIFWWVLSLSLTATQLQGRETSDTPTRVMTPYTAHYQSTARGVDIDLYRQLLPGDADTYQLESHGEKMMYGFQESSSFTVTGEQLIPVFYQYRGKGLNRRETLTRFDWAKGTAASEYKGKDYTLALEPGLLDPLSWQEFLRHQLLQDTAPQALDQTTLRILDGRRIKEYVLEYNGIETVSTATGYFTALRFTRLGRKPGRYLQFWLAVDWDFLLIKAQHRNEDGQSVIATLRDARINDETVVGLGNAGKNPITQQHHETTH